jgi:Spy/CpxP family protein refolding chaperone
MRFLDINRPFVQQLRKSLDSEIFPSYFADDRTSRRNAMKSIRIVSAGAILLFALTTTGPGAAAQRDGWAQEPHTQAAAEEHLKVLTEKLALTEEQQAKAKPILEKMQDATQKFVQDESMSRDERMDNVRAVRYKADRELRKVLTDEQKKTLDQLEEEQHSKMHDK